MNEKLALNDDILMKIEKPARYIGNEVNAVVKDRDSIDVRFCMCFPDVYEIGMSHLGIQILYGMLNSWDDVWCERVYSPWVDLDEIMRKENIPLFALESQDPIKDFDFLGITISRVHIPAENPILNSALLSHVLFPSNDAPIFLQN